MKVEIATNMRRKKGLIQREQRARNVRSNRSNQSLQSNDAAVERRAGHAGPFAGILVPRVPV